MTSSEKRAEGPPFVGALARLCFQKARRRVEAAIRAAGGTDVHETHLAVFSYPLPDGARPSELARRVRISRQAANHLIAQLESLGYFERRSLQGAARRLGLNPGTLYARMKKLGIRRPAVGA